MGAGSFVVIEGIDGAGKSSVACRVAERLTCSGRLAVYRPKSAIHSADPLARAHLEQLKDLLWPPPQRDPPRDLFGTHHYLYLLAAWFSAADQHGAPAGGEGVITLTDGWFYRTAVKAHLRGGIALPWALSLFEPARAPDRVVLLDLDPAVAWSRRAVFKPAEAGAWDGYGGDPFTDFCAYQARVRGHLLDLAAERGWPVVRQTARTTLDQAAHAVLESLTPG